MRFAYGIAVAAVLSAWQAAAFTLVSPDAPNGRIVVASAEPESVALAARDLASDLRKITSRQFAVLRGNAPKPGDIFVHTRSDGRWEAYDFVDANGVLDIAGSDDLGTVFGIYAFCDEYLGVDPFYLWNGCEPKRRSSLQWDSVAIHQGEPTYRFRGWFLNDEDMLTGWLEESGRRAYLDGALKFYDSVPGNAAHEMLAETLVRARCNLIIPASLVNISNPPEKRILDICAKRGIYLSQHHIEPLGTSSFAFVDYWKQRGKKLSYSYVAHPREVEEVWRHQARAWAQYPRVIWQIGLRGVGDRSAWQGDPTAPKDDAGRAKFIAKAMSRQMEILDEVGVPREGRQSTTTLWAEGAVFYERGLLEIPPTTTVVFADNNSGWQWQRDLTSGRRIPGQSYGVYYHHGLIGQGPHLVSLVPAARTHAMLSEAREKGAANYVICNVGNVREFPYGLDATSRMTWNLDSFSVDAWLDGWVARHFSSDRVAWKTAYAAYYSSLELSAETGLPLFLDGLLHSEIDRAISRLRGKFAAKDAFDPAPSSVGTPPFRHGLEATMRREGGVKDAKTDPFWGSLAKSYQFLNDVRPRIARLSAQQASYSRVLKLVRKLYDRAPESEKDFAYDYLVYPAELMCAMTGCALELNLAEDNLGLGDRAAAVENLARAVKLLEREEEVAHKYCHGKWNSWRRNCVKVNPSANLKRLQKLQSSITN